MFSNFRNSFLFYRPIAAYSNRANSTCDRSECVFAFKGVPATTVCSGRSRPHAPLSQCTLNKKGFAPKMRPYLGACKQPPAIRTDKHLTDKAGAVKISSAMCAGINERSTRRMVTIGHQFNFKQSYQIGQTKRTIFCPQQPVDRLAKTTFFRIFCLLAFEAWQSLGLSSNHWDLKECRKFRFFNLTKSATQKAFQKIFWFLQDFIRIYGDEELQKKKPQPADERTL